MGLYSTLFYYATLFAGSVLTALAAITAGEIGENMDWDRRAFHDTGLQQAIDAASLEALKLGRDKEPLIIEEEMTKMD